MIVAACSVDLDPRRLTGRLVEDLDPLAQHEAFIQARSSDDHMHGSGTDLCMHAPMHGRGSGRSVVGDD